MYFIETVFLVEIVLNDEVEAESSETQISANLDKTKTLCMAKNQCRCINDKTFLKHSHKASGAKNINVMLKVLKSSLIKILQPT